MENFGSGKSYIPQAQPPDNDDLRNLAREQQVQAQGLWDLFKLTDKETIEKVKAIVAAVDPEKIKGIMDMIETDEEGWTRIKIDLRIRK